MEDLKALGGVDEHSGLAGLGDKLEKMLKGQTETPTAPAAGPEAAPAEAPADEGIEAPGVVAVEAAPAEAPADDIPEWLKELRPADVEPEAPAPAEAPADDIPEWLKPSWSSWSADVEPEAPAAAGPELPVAPETAPEAAGEAVEADESVGEVGEELPEAAAGPAEEAMEFPAMSFAARVKAAGGLVARAVKEVGGLGGLLEKVAEEQRIAAEMRQGLSGETGISIPELSDKELETLKKAYEILASHEGDDGMNAAKLVLTTRVLEQQEQYKLGKEMAEAADREYGAELKKAAKELEPGWFKKEPAVVREMAELQEFFDRIGNVEKLNLTKAEIEAEKATKMWQNGAVKENYKKDREAELKRVETELAMLESAEKFMARADIPKTLREVIAAGRVGRESLFGAGPVDNFRRRVYESIIETLGVEADPALEAVEATPSPEPEPILPPESMVAPPEVVAVEVAAPLVPEEEAAPVLVEAPEAEEVSAPVETPEQRVERRKQGFAGALAELDRARNDTSGTEGEQRIRFAEAYNQAIGAAMEFMEEGDVARETVKGFLAGALGIPNGSQLMEIVVGDRLDQAGVTGAPAGEKKKKLEKAGLLGLLELLLELGMSFTDKSIGAVVAEVQTATGAGR